MSDPVDNAFEQLRHEYLSSMPSRLEELRSDAATFLAGAADAGSALKTRLHRLAGSGGSYGFLDISRTAREAEHWLAAHPTPADVAGLTPLLERLFAAIERAEAEAAGRRGGGEAGR